AQDDQGSQIKMIQVKEMMQDNDLKNSKSKDKGSRSRSQSMNEQSHYKQDKTKTRQSINVKSHIFNVRGDNDKTKQTPTRMSSVARILELKRRISRHCSDNLYAVSNKEDMAYLCLHCTRNHEELKSNTSYPEDSIRCIEDYLKILEDIERGSPTESPISIYGPVDRIKSLFDAVWITAAHVSVNAAQLDLVLLMDFKENMLSGYYC
ncbi:hypothetical protein Tco_0880229, partial [Tanacetum coccineum]